MKILMTGTHFTPAQAVIEEFRKHKDIQIVYFGRKYTREGDSTLSAESQVLPSLGVKFIPIITGRLQRTFTPYTIPSLLKIPIGFIQSFYYLLKENPDVILSFGGYVAVPTIINGWLLSIPSIIHEQTLVPGLANQISSLFANKIAVSFDKHPYFDSKKVIITGNPIRKELLEFHDAKSILSAKSKGVNKQYLEIVQVSKKDKLPLIFITGGNQGSHNINETVEAVLEDLTKIACVIHQTGDSKYHDFEHLEDKKQKLKYPHRYLVKKWIDAVDMGFIISQADLAVSRAGINTLLEFAYFGLPSLVIPIPYVAKDEQTVNAKFFASIGLAEVLLQKDLSPESLYIKVEQMLKELSKLKKSAQKASSIVHTDAAKKLVLETILLAKEKM